jgi:hypothetical protein
MKITSIHTYLTDLDKKIKNIRSISAMAGSPKIGIFWITHKNGIFSVFDGSMYPIELGLDYGQFIIAKEDHWQTWEMFKRKGIVPPNSEYEDIPRGRVLYDTSISKYKVFTGKWANPQIKSAITNAYHLPTNTIWDTDSHYDQYSRWSID